MGTRDRLCDRHSHPPIKLSLAFKSVCVGGGGEGERERDKKTEEVFRRSNRMASALGLSPTSPCEEENILTTAGIWLLDRILGIQVLE